MQTSSKNAPESECKGGEACMSMWGDKIHDIIKPSETRERVFVVSIRKDLPISKTFRFPAPLPQTVLLRDLLEDNPEKKYFLAEETVEYYKNQSEQ